MNNNNMSQNGSANLFGGETVLRTQNPNMSLNKNSQMEPPKSDNPYASNMNNNSSNPFGNENSNPFVNNNSSYGVDFFDSSLAGYNLSDNYLIHSVHKRGSKRSEGIVARREK